MVDINNLRIQAGHAYSRLITILNQHISEHDEICIPVDKIQDHINDLGTMIATLACCSLKDDPNFKEVIDDIGEIPDFNPE